MDFNINIVVYVPFVNVHRSEKNKQKKTPRSIYNTAKSIKQIDCENPVFV